jgi:hypothetical protein
VSKYYNRQHKERESILSKGNRSRVPDSPS